MSFENLSDRERVLLSHLIDHYVSSATPVGSRVLANQYYKDLSSASIRNILQDLEEQGLVTQPHTSAGRVPTDTGYRLYVDTLLKAETLTESERERIRLSVSGAGKSIDAILGQTTRILAEIAHQMGVTVAPKFDQGILKRLQLVRISSERILVAIVVKSGLAQSVILEVEAKIKDDELTALESILNEKLSGLTLGEIRQTISARLASVEGDARLLKLFIDTKSAVWNQDSESQTHVVGAENLMSQPEFADRDNLLEFVRTVEERNKLIDAVNGVGGAPTSLGAPGAPGVVVTIGSENPTPEVKRCSVVSAEYKVGRVKGRVALIGPTRMRYSRLVSIVEYTAQSLTDKLRMTDSD